MADENFGIVVEIDPRPALTGTAQVDKALEKNEQSAKDFATVADESMRAAAAAARAAAKETERAIVAANKAAAQAAKAASRESELAAKAQERAQVDAARKAAAAQKASADAQKQAQAQLAASYRAIVGPAAEYNAKLAQAVALERQGAITAQQRANAIRGMQREMAAHNAKQQGGIRGAIGEAAASQLGAVAGPAAAAGVAVTAVKGLIEYGDQYTALTNKIRASTESEAEAIRVRERLFKTANDARVPVESLTALYAQARIATKDLGTSQGELIRVSELLSKATRGVGEANRSAGLQQFGQALTKGKLQAEELMSIMENIPKVGVLLAEGMGMTVGELRKAAEAGKVGTQDMLDAIQKMGPAIEREFTNASGTAAESWAVFKNQVLQTAGGFAEQIHLNELLSKALAQVGVALKGIGDMVSFTIDGWKELNSITDGWAGKIATAPGLLGNVSELSGRIASQYLFGAEMLELQASWSERLTRDTAKRTEELDKQLGILRNSTFFEGYSKDEKGRATGYGIGGNFLRDALAMERAAKQRKDKEAAERWSGDGDAEKASRANAAAVREAAAAWKEWIGEVKQNGAGVLERIALRIEDVTSSVRDLAAESIATAEATRVANENMIAFAQSLGGDLLDSLTAAGEMVTEFAEGGALEEGTAQIEGLSLALTETLGSALDQTIDAFVEFANGGKASFSDLARSVLADLEKMLIKFLAFQAIKAAFGVSTGGFGAILAGSLGINLGNNATGGSYVVPSTGGGGVDSVPIYARATPGERVTFTPPGQAGPGGGGPPANVNVKTVVVADFHAASLEAMRTPQGERAIIAAIAANPGAVRAAVGR